MKVVKAYMKKLCYIITLTALLGGITFPAFAGESASYVSASTTDEDPQGTMTIDVYINGVNTVKLEDIPTEGFLDVYSVLGVKVTSVNLKNCIANCTLDLPKGIYVLKAGRVAKKIIVK